MVFSEGVGTNVLTIDANVGSYVYSLDTLQRSKINLSAQEGAKINIKLYVKQLLIKSITGANIQVSGKAKHQDMSIFTEGIFEGKLSLTDDTNVSIKAAGEASVHGSHKVMSKVIAGGHIFIFCNLVQVE